MKGSHEDRRPPGRVSEAVPVQVFLGQEDKARLDRLAEQLGTSKSDVLRQSLAALERQLLDPRTHPALRLIGLVDDDTGAVDGVDVARDHDAYLAARVDAAIPPAAPRKSSRVSEGQRGRRKKS